MRKRRNVTLLLVISLLIIVLFGADVLLGSVSLSPADVWGAISGGKGGAGDGAAYDVARSVVMKFRLPKAAVALVAGAALSASGLQMQTLFRNPLAGPFVLGISSGASLGVALFLLGLPLLGVGAGSEVIRNLGMAGSAWVGSALIFLIIMAVSVRIKDIMVILILGMMIGSAATAFIEILQYFSPEGALKSFVIWSMASVGGVTAGQLGVMLPVCLIGLLLSVVLIKPLNMLLLGENYARTMGLNIRLTRGIIFLSTTLLAGTVTAFCGPIGFIGIAVPHVARMIFTEADHRVLMPASMLLGGAVMLACDIISQMPGNDLTLPVNTITALLGIPIVVMVIVRNRKIF